MLGRSIIKESEGMNLLQTESAVVGIGENNLQISQPRRLRMPVGLYASSVKGDALQRKDSCIRGEATAISSIQSLDPP
jgi:hypothetical protein